MADPPWGRWIWGVMVDPPCGRWIRGVMADLPWGRWLRGAMTDPPGRRCIWGIMTGLPGRRWILVIIMKMSIFTVASQKLPLGTGAEGLHLLYLFWTLIHKLGHHRQISILLLLLFQLSGRDSRPAHIIINDPHSLAASASRLRPFFAPLATGLWTSFQASICPRQVTLQILSLGERRSCRHGSGEGGATARRVGQNSSTRNGRGGASSGSFRTVAF